MGWGVGGWVGGVRTGDGFFGVEVLIGAVFLEEDSMGWVGGMRYCMHAMGGWVGGVRTGGGFFGVEGLVGAVVLEEDGMGWKDGWVGGWVGYVREVGSLGSKFL